MRERERPHANTRCSSHTEDGGLVDWVDEDTCW